MSAERQAPIRHVPVVGSIVALPETTGELGLPLSQPAKPTGLAAVWKWLATHPITPKGEGSTGDSFLNLGIWLAVALACAFLIGRKLSR